MNMELVRLKIFFFVFSRISFANADSFFTLFFGLYLYPSYFYYSVISVISICFLFRAVNFNYLYMKVLRMGL